MNKIISILVVTSVVGHGAFASIEAKLVTSPRSFTIALEANEKINRYVRGFSKASPDIFLEILQFADEIDSQQTGLNEKATEMLTLAEEVGSQLKTLDLDTRTALSPIVTSLLTKFPVREKNTILLRIINRLWLWSPDHLDFMASKVRNDWSHLISTQLLWILEHASPEQRHAFFIQIPEKLNPNIRWFPYALAYKFDRPIDLRNMKRMLSAANPEKLRPTPIPITLNGAALPTTADLYKETQSRLREDLLGNKCPSYLVEVPKSTSS